MSETMSISAEDREKLAKSKFGEWFDELFEERFENAVKKMVEAGGGEPQGQQGQQQQGQQGQQQQQRSPSIGRRRSLLETCLSDTFGF